MNFFDKEISRIDSGSIKWDNMESTKYNGQVIPMWIADMDFDVAPAIKDEMRKRIDFGVFGYEDRPSSYNKAIVEWFNRRHDYHIKPEWICFAHDVVAAIGTAIEAVSDEGDGIIIQSPVYHMFYKVIESKKRKIIKNPLINNNGYYTMNFENLEKIITDKTKALILCNPHNPVGRVWTDEELLKLIEICLKHNIWIISDDIHCEMVFKGYKHTFVSSLSKNIAQKTIVCTSPSKAFNLAGIKLANTIIQNEKIREKYMSLYDRPVCNSFVAPALIGAYNYSEQWLDKSVEYIEGNIDYFVSYVKNNIPKLSVVKPEGTYLVWLDCTQLGMEPEELKTFFLDICGVYPNGGIVFGEEGRYYQRLNLACRRELVVEALKRIENGVNKLK